MNTTLTTDTAPLNEADARELTEQIAEGLADVHSLIVQAWEGRAWESLGYQTWDAWIDVSFRGLQLRPPREQRSEVVQSMREAGMSVRAISQATDLGYGTVRRAAETGEPNGSPAEGPAVVGLDGKSYTAPQQKAHNEDDAAEADFGSLSLADLGVPSVDRSKLRPSGSEPSSESSGDVLSGDVVEPGGESSDSEPAQAWWEGPRAALVETESRCVALLEQRRAEPRLVEDPQDPGPSQLTMTAARTVLAAGGVIVDLGVDDLDAEAQGALRKVLGTVIESLDGVIGDLEEVDDGEA